MGDTKARARLSVDLIILMIISFVVFGLYYAFKKDIFNYITDTNNDVILRALVTAGLHFCQAGLPACIIMAFRKEKFSDYGLNSNKIMFSIAHSTLILLIYSVIIVIRGTWRLFYPFRIVTVPYELLSSPIYIMVIGMLIFTILSGFFEGFTYVYISKKLNARWPAKNIFLSPGPIILSVVGFIMHSVTGVNGFEGSWPLLILIYGLLLIYEKTGNAWGCVSIFCLIWNVL